MADCLFCKFANKELAVNAVYEDDWALAFRDINPQAPVHILVIPKVHVADVMEAGNHPGLMEHLFQAVRAVVKEQCGEGASFRTVMNTGSQAGQSVGHLHIHVLSGRAMGWPPG